MSLHPWWSAWLWTRKVFSSRGRGCCEHCKVVNQVEIESYPHRISWENLWLKKCKIYRDRWSGLGYEDFVDRIFECCWLEILEVVGKRFLGQSLASPVGGVPVPHWWPRPLACNPGERGWSRSWEPWLPEGYRKCLDGDWKTLQGNKIYLQKIAP